MKHFFTADGQKRVAWNDVENIKSSMEQKLIFLPGRARYGYDIIFNAAN